MTDDPLDLFGAAPSNVGDEAPHIGGPVADGAAPHQRLIARRRARDARRRGTRNSHECPCCGRRTFRRIRHYPTLGYDDARCQPCADKNFWPEQHTDHRRTKSRR